MTDRELLELLVQKVTSMETNMATKQEVTGLADKITNIDNRLGNVEGQLSETNEIVKSLRHNNEEINAQLHSLGHEVNQITGQLTKLATKEEIDRLGLDIAFLVRKAAEHESDIRKLHLAE